MDRTSCAERRGRVRRALAAAAVLSVTLAGCSGTDGRTTRTGSTDIDATDIVAAVSSGPRSTGAPPTTIDPGTAAAIAPAEAGGPAASSSATRSPVGPGAATPPPAATDGPADPTRADPGPATAGSAGTEGSAAAALGSADAGANVDSGDLSDTSALMPDLTGAPVAEARRLMAGSPLRLIDPAGVELDDADGSGVVCGQTPPAGAQADAATATLTVAPSSVDC